MAEITENNNSVQNTTEPNYKRLLAYAQLLQKGAIEFKNQINELNNYKQSNLTILKSEIPNKEEIIQKLKTISTSEITLCSRINRWIDSSDKKYALSLLNQNLNHPYLAEITKELQKILALTIQEEANFKKLIENASEQNSLIQKLNSNSTNKDINKIEILIKEENKIIHNIFQNTNTANDSKAKIIDFYSKNLAKFTSMAASITAITATNVQAQELLAEINNPSSPINPQNIQNFNLQDNPLIAITIMGMIVIVMPTITMGIVFRNIMKYEKQKAEENKINQQIKLKRGPEVEALLINIRNKLITHQEEYQKYLDTLNQIEIKKEELILKILEEAKSTGSTRKAIRSQYQKELFKTLISEEKYRKSFYEYALKKFNDSSINTLIPSTTGANNPLLDFLINTAQSAIELIQNIEELSKIVRGVNYNLIAECSNETIGLQRAIERIDTHNIEQFLTRLFTSSKKNDVINELQTEVEKNKNKYQKNKEIRLKLNQNLTETMIKLFNSIDKSLTEIKQNIPYGLEKKEQPLQNTNAEYKENEEDLERLERRRKRRKQERNASFAY